MIDPQLEGKIALVTGANHGIGAAKELDPLGITVNIVSPGPIQTGYIPPGNEPTIVADTPLGRVGAPDDVADVIVYLASEQARWVTGQLIHVGGGHRM